MISRNGALEKGHASKAKKMRVRNIILLLRVQLLINNDKTEEYEIK